MENKDELIEKLANKLGTTAEYLWNVLIKQSQVELTIDFIWMSLFGIYLLIYFSLIKRMIKSENPLISEGVARLSSIIALVSILFLCMSINEVIVLIKNPEYWALNEILKSIR